MTLKDSHYKEIMKLYPSIRIPYMKEAAYYIELLSRNDPSIEHIFEDFSHCAMIHGDVTSYKMKKFDEILKYFKEDSGLLDSFNSQFLPASAEMVSKYPKSFGNWKEDTTYVSIDMNSANWSVFNFISQLKSKKSWTEFVSDYFELHPFIAQSKSFRQFVLGNLNPSRQQSYQKAFMIELAETFTTFGMPEPVMLSADEILFEIPKDWKNYSTPQYSDLKYSIKETRYCMEVHTSNEERVLVKRNLGTNKRELFSIQGTRYFIHYKNIILQEPIEDRDLYFEPEPKRLAKWVL